jgi:hypothetical protein
MRSAATVQAHPVEAPAPSPAKPFLRGAGCREFNANRINADGEFIAAPKAQATPMWSTICSTIVQWTILKAF